jgi:hypothetical protein
LDFFILLLMVVVVVSVSSGLQSKLFNNNALISALSYTVEKFSPQNHLVSKHLLVSTFKSNPRSMSSH